jgi:hypothetical protein
MSDGSSPSAAKKACHDGSTEPGSSA